MASLWPLAGIKRNPREKWTREKVNLFAAGSEAIKSRAFHDEMRALQLVDIDFPCAKLLPTK
jgi:hypothetical protein